MKLCSAIVLASALVCSPAIAQETRGTSGLTLNPLPGTTNQGIVINQSGPNTGSQVPNLLYNQVIVQDGVNVTGGSNTSAFYIQQNLLSNIGGQKFALFVNSLRDSGATVSTGDQIGIVSFTESSVSAGGTNTGAGAKGTLFAGNPIVTLSSGATNYFLISGTEFDIQANTGSSVSLRYGIDIVGVGAVNGATQDAAIAIASNGSTAWNNGILFTQGAGQWGSPLSTTACVICTDGNATTIAKMIDLGSYTITGNILFTKPLEIDNNGTYWMQRSGSAGSVASLAGRSAISVAANASLGTNINTSSGIYLYRDQTSGGAALVAIEAGTTPTIIWQSQTNFVTADPGAGTSKWFIQNSSGHFGDALNRYAVTHSISYVNLSSDGGVFP